jgi:D-citramalate synthase
VFTQTAGVHADGDAKAALYCSDLKPERFARRREYALGKLSGRASLGHHLRELGIELDPRLSPAEKAELIEQLLVKVVEQGDRKQRVRPSDLEAWLAPTMLR